MAVGVREDAAAGSSSKLRYIFAIIFFGFNAETQQGWTSWLWDHQGTLSLTTIQPDQLDNLNRSKHGLRLLLADVWLQ